MKVAFVADVHLGNHRRHGGAVESGMNARCRATVAVLDQAVRRARSLGCTVFSILGDVFDTDHPPPQVIAAAQRALQMETYVLLGNHDQVSTADGDHALGPLDGYGMVEVIDKPQELLVGGCEFWMVPFKPGDARLWLPEALKTFEGNSRGVCSRVLCLHLGIIDDETPPWLRNAHDAVPLTLVHQLCEQYAVRAVLAGNWHQRKVWQHEGTTVVQVGALVPTGWDNPGVGGYGTLVIYDTEALTLSFEVLPGPRFVKLGSVDDARLAALDARATGHQLYLQYVAPPDQLSAVQLQLAGLEVEAFEVVPDGQVSTHAARLAAEAARSGDTLSESLNGFVNDMVLDVGVDRAAVLRRARGYLWVDAAIAALKETT